MEINFKEYQYIFHLSTFSFLEIKLYFAVYVTQLKKENLLFGITELLFWNAPHEIFISYNDNFYLSENFYKISYVRTAEACIFHWEGLKELREWHYLDYLWQ